jgi:hypothetical protein
MALQHHESVGHDAFIFYHATEEVRAVVYGVAIEYKDLLVASCKHRGYRLDFVAIVKNVSVSGR